jgi:DNA-binding Lrp family transcriptional regulator
MIDEKIIVKFSAIVDMEKLGYNTVGWLGLTIDPLKRDEIIKKLASYKLIKMISSTTGDYNLIVQILAENEKKLWSFIRDDIQTVEGVHDVQVSSSLKVHKWETAYFLRL